jgi:hypothetical protein
MSLVRNRCTQSLCMREDTWFSNQIWHQQKQHQNWLSLIGMKTLRNLINLFINRNRSGRVTFREMLLARLHVRGPTVHVPARRRPRLDCGSGGAAHGGLVALATGGSGGASKWWCGGGSARTTINRHARGPPGRRACNTRGRRWVADDVRDKVDRRNWPTKQTGTSVSRFFVSIVFRWSSYRQQFAR